MDKETRFLSEVTIDKEFNDELKEALASLNYNTFFASPVSFIFTDSFRNANKQRVPEDEFDNVIKTGASMPIKMNFEDGTVNNHARAGAIGVITHLKKFGKQVRGLGLLWKEENKEEVEYVKSCIDNRTPVNLSWELGYTDSSFDEDGTEVLHGVVVRATTIVSKPAYENRTPILSIASSEEQLMEELQAKIDELTAQLEQKISELTEKDSKISELEKTVSELSEQNTSLAEFKRTIEVEAEKKQKVESIKNKFKQAGLEKDEQYFADREQKLLSLSEDELEFLLQEMISFKTESALTESASSVQIPNVVSTKTRLTPVELGKSLRELDNIKRGK